MKISKILLLAAIFMVANLYADPPNWNPIQGTQYSMVLIASATVDDVEFTGEGANILAVFGPGGENDCRGLATWNAGGFWYFTIVSNDNGDALSFLIYNESTDEIIECAQTIYFADNDVIGTPEEPFIISSGSANGTLSGHINLINTHSTNIDITDVIVQANSITTQPDTNGDFSMVVPAGNYTLSATYPNFNCNPIANIALSNGENIENIDISMIDWDVIGGTQYSFTIMANLEISGEIIPKSDSNFLGAFGPLGYSDCRALATWQPANPPHWNGYWFLTVVGNLNGEEINFVYYDEEENICSETIAFSDNANYGEPTAPYTLTAGLIEQTIDLTTNWNWISFNIQPESPNIPEIFAGVESNVYQIKNQNSSSTYYPGISSWVGDLYEITPGSAYLIKMLQPDQITIGGETIDINTPISLDQFWNWIAFYPQTSLTLDNALSSILPNLLQIKDQDQTAFYYNPPGSWVGDLDEMIPGNGYKIKMSAADELIYSNEARVISQKKTTISRDLPNWEVIPGTQYSMVVMLQAELDGQPFNNLGNNTVGIFGSGGEEDCHGIGVWQQIDENGFWYITVVGNEIDEELTIKIYNEADDTIYSNEDILIFEDNATIGNIDNPYLTTFSTTSIDEEELLSHKMQIYPNPFSISNNRNQETTISFEHKNLEANSKIDIYNIKGQRVNSLILNENNLADNYIHWNGKNSDNCLISSGIYFIRLQSANKTIATKRCVVIK